MTITRWQFSVRTLLLAIIAATFALILYPVVFPKRREVITPEGYRVSDETGVLPDGIVFWFANSDGEPVCGLVAVGKNRPQILVSHQDCNIYVPDLHPERIYIPQDGSVYILSRSFELIRTDLDLTKWFDSINYAQWGSKISRQIRDNTWD